MAGEGFVEVVVDREQSSSMSSLPMPTPLSSRIARAGCGTRYASTGERRPRPWQAPGRRHVAEAEPVDVDHDGARASATAQHGPRDS
jgi:hypothetical protein